MKKKSSWVYRLGVYRIKLSKNEFSATLVSRRYRWRVTEGDGEGDITRFCLKDADTSDSICQRTYIGRTTLKESVDHLLTARLI